MTDLKFKLGDKKLHIDGLYFDKPKTWLQHIEIGLCTLGIIILFPLWIIPYLTGKAIKNIAGESKYSSINYLCPRCGRVINRVGELMKIKCIYCNWSGYLDHMDSIEEKK